MKGIVNIFGGLYTKINYFKYAIEIYKKHEFTIDFHEAKGFGFNIMIPNKYENNVREIYDELLMNNQKINLGKIPKIIHTNSGGLWSGLEFNNSIKHNGFVIEAGPLSIFNLKKFQHTIYKTYNIYLNLHIIQYFMNFYGIPTVKYDENWIEKYERQILKLPTTTILNGDKDDYLDREYIKKFVSQLQEKQIEVKNVNFKEGTHHRIAKSDIELYQKTIDEMCIKAKKSVL
jgi:hypothetical protein